MLQRTRPVTIANGQTTSTGFNKGAYPFAAIHIPADFEGTTLSFNVAEKEGGSYLPLKKPDGTAVSLTVAAGTVAALTGDVAAALAPCEWVQLVAGAAQAGGDTVLTMLQGVA